MTGRELYALFLDTALIGGVDPAVHPRWENLSPKNQQIWDRFGFVVTDLMREDVLSDMDHAGP